MKGLASWKDGRLSSYPAFAGKIVQYLLQDHEGTIWVSTLETPASKLCAISGSSGTNIRCYGDKGEFGLYINRMYEDSKGNLWVPATNGTWRWRPGPPTRYDTPPAGTQMLLEIDKGTLLAAGAQGLFEFTNGKFKPYAIPGVGDLHLRLASIFRSSDGSLWLGTADRGILHVHQDKTDWYTRMAGLSADFVAGFFEDREGNIWVGTNSGLDRFHDVVSPLISTEQGLPDRSQWSLLAATDGSVWSGSPAGVTRWKDGQFTVYRAQSGQSLKRGKEHLELGPKLPVREIFDSGLPASVQSLYQDDRGRLWATSSSGLFYFDGMRFVSAKGISGGNLYSMAGDGHGGLWVTNEAHGLFHLEEGNGLEQIPWPRLGAGDNGFFLASDPQQGGVWLGMWPSAVLYLNHGQVRARYTQADGVGGGWVSHLRVEKDGSVWAATEDGLTLVKNGRVATLSSKNGLPCNPTHWSMPDDVGSVWLYMTCALVRVSRSDLDAWSADPKRQVHPTVFDSFDGVILMPSRNGGYGPRVAKSADGKLWMVMPEGIGVLDPRHIPFNKLPPPVHIEQINADRKAYWQNLYGDASSSRPKLPPLVRDLEIDYTALSMVVPEKNRFRVKLEGWDSDWKDVGNERRAFYSNLPPRNYRFRVAASNNSGVWNEAGASLDFSVAPAYYQTTWFRAACVAAFLAFLWGLYRLRVRQLAREFNMGLEARVSERTRIARELHDTLLQSFQGLLLRFQSAVNALPGRPEEARKRLVAAIDQAAEAITEGREAVQHLRSSATLTNDIAAAVGSIGEELAAGEINASAASFSLQVEGKTRDLHPIVRDEICRVASEAMRNAFRHAHAGRIELDLRYDDRQLWLRVRDNGKGIDPKILEADGVAGHWGLHGMRERAKSIGGDLAVWSELDSGTEVELVVPARIAYQTRSTTRKFWFSRKKNPTEETEHER